MSETRLPLKRFRQEVKNAVPIPYRLKALVLVLGLCLAGGLAAAEQEQVTLNLKNADIQTLIETVSRATGLNFIVDPRVKAKVNVISSRPMSADKLYETFLSILDVHGFSAIRSGDVVKVVPDVNAKQSAVPLLDGEADNRDETVTRVVPLQHVSAQPLMTVLRQLMPQQAAIATHTESNALIITDRAANIERLVDIIRRVDRVDSDEIEIINLQHADATEVVRTLTSLRKGEAGKAPENALAFAVDERTNSVLISGDKTQRLKLRALITHLDTPKARQGNTRVIYLRYASAVDLAEMLRQMYASPQAGAKEKPSQEGLGIYADEATNALVITAAAEMQRDVASVIEQLDIRRAQVLVEAVIAEVSDDLTRELGVQMVVDGSSNDNGPVGVTVFGGEDSILNLASEATAANALGQGINLALGNFDRSGTDFALLLRALNGDAATNVLATPSIMTLDNQEAKIVVGKNVPFITGSYTSVGGSGSTPTNPFQTIERQDVGLTLRVKPQISEGGVIKLEIEQEVSSLSVDSAVTSDVVTNKRNIMTTVLVEDGQMLVLGGLIDENITESEQKVPGLGDVPLLGELFRYREAKRVKQNLMVFLRPIIVSDKAVADSATRSKYEYLRGRQLRAGDDRSLLGPDARTTLPQLDRLLLNEPTLLLPAEAPQGD